MTPLPKGEIWCCCVEDWQAPAVFYSSRIPSLEERKRIREMMMPFDLVSHDPERSPALGGRPIAILRNQAVRFPERWVPCTPAEQYCLGSCPVIRPRAGGDRDGG